MFPNKCWLQRQDPKICLENLYREDGVRMNFRNEGNYLQIDSKPEDLDCYQHHCGRLKSHEYAIYELLVCFDGCFYVIIQRYAYLL
jgi:hypothetical protein